MATNVSKDLRKCTKCGEIYQPTSNRQLYCYLCKKELTREYDRMRHRRKPKKGYNQTRENNNHWRGGIGWYKTVAKEVGHCERCMSTKFLLVHHKDHNRSNNDRSNLEVLCQKVSPDRAQMLVEPPKSSLEGIVRARSNTGTTRYYTEVTSIQWRRIYTFLLRKQKSSLGASKKRCPLCSPTLTL